MNVPFVDLKAGYLEIQDEINAAIRDVLENSQFIRGPRLETFEREFADFVGAEYCVGVSNGTEAYKPPVKSTTWLLWAGPFLLLLLAFMTLVATVRRQAKLPDAESSDEDITP